MRILCRFLATIVLVAFAFAASADVMLWTVDANAIVDGSSDIFTFLTPMPYDEDNVYGAKVAMKDSNGNFIRYLDNYFDYGGGDTEWSNMDVDIGHPSDSQVGVSWMQSKMSNDELMEMAFQIELGHNIWNYATEMYDWTTIAKSDTVEGQWLLQ